MTSVRTLFLGSNWESVDTLRVLYQDPRFDVVGAITRTDKPVGRKKVMTPTKVKKYAVENGIDVFHTENSKDKYKEAIKKFKPDLVVVKAFGEIIPAFFLEAPKYGSVNVHFSLLPKYRGAVPIQKAIWDGEEVTGITIMEMAPELDGGDIIIQYEEKILETDTNQSLRERLVKKAADVLADVLEQWVDGKIKATPQDDSLATFCWQRDIAKEKAEINWEQDDPGKIERMIRALIPWPVAWTYLDGKRVKIFAANLVDNSVDAMEIKTGVFSSRQERLFVGTKDPKRLIQVLDLQVEGGSRMAAAEFIRGKDL